MSHINAHLDLFCWPRAQTWIQVRRCHYQKFSGERNQREHIQATRKPKYMQEMAMEPFRVVLTLFFKLQPTYNHISSFRNYQITKNATSGAHYNIGYYIWKWKTCLVFHRPRGAIGWSAVFWLKHHQVSTMIARGLLMQLPKYQQTPIKPIIGGTKARRSSYEMLTYLDLHCWNFNRVSLALVVMIMCPLPIIRRGLKREGSFAVVKHPFCCFFRE